MDSKGAHYQLLLADRLCDDARQPGMQVVRAQLDLLGAEEMREDAKRELQLDEQPVVGIGGELVESVAEENSLSRKTLRSNRVTTKASVERLNLIHGVDAFDLALDAAESIGASNSLEKMIAHGIAVAHKTAMDLLERNKERCDPVDEVRRVNAAARLMGVVQTGALTIQRLRTGGNQVMTVRHITVEAGGQAVIGNVGDPPAERDRKE